jgi:hypothetical protein
MARTFWVEAVNTACYVSNRIYLRVHKKKTCYELMHGRTPKVMMNLARRSFRKRSMNMYTLLRLRWWTAPLPHLRQQTKIKEKLLLRRR